ncbi:kinase binding protein CGI-121-domain-containing protein [Cladochytrium replicatum]|nr:kinase binding protein CGI-121-domain-containing protein [Cladochytrium replicatum]
MSLPIASFALPSLFLTPLPPPPSEIAPILSASPTAQSFAPHAQSQNLEPDMPASLAQGIPSHILAESPTKLEHNLPAMHIVLFRNVKNADALRKRVIAADPAIPDCVLVNAALVVDVFQVQTAATRAFLAQRQNTMKTKTLLSEVLYNISPLFGISESLKTIGLSKSTTAILAVMFAENEPLDKFQSLASCIDGTPSPVYELELERDTLQIAKLFNLDQTLSKSPDRLLELVVGTIALKNYS